MRLGSDSWPWFGPEVFPVTSLRASFGLRILPWRGPRSVGTEHALDVQSVAAPGGPVAFGPSASGALATNGTGSVLAGLVGTFLARGMDPFAAAAAAVLARSDAGNVAATHVGAGHTVAEDVIQALPEALAPRRD